MSETTSSIYVVCEIPEPVSSRIKELRTKFDLKTASLPVEITLAGSSGVGPIQLVGPTFELKNRIVEILRNVRSFKVRFSSIEKFPNSSVYYLCPEERDVFDNIHGLLTKSDIEFSHCSWPYNPHCTISATSALNEENEALLFGSEFPTKQFVVDTISLYSFSSATYKCELLGRISLPS